MTLKMTVIMGLQSKCPYLHFVLSHDVEDSVVDLEPEQIWIRIRKIGTDLDPELK